MAGAHSPSAAAASVHVWRRGGSLRASLASLFRTGFVVHNPRAAAASVHASGRDCSRCTPALPALIAWGRVIAAGFAEVPDGGAAGRASAPADSGSPAAASRPMKPAPAGAFRPVAPLSAARAKGAPTSGPLRGTG